MRRKPKTVESPPANYLRRLSLSPGEVKAAFRSNMRRLKLRRTKNGYSATIHVTLGDGMETENENVVVSGTEDLTARHGVVSAIGKRSEMEDEVRAEVALVKKGDKSYDFYGVYDGHGGRHVASTCRERLHVMVAREIVSSHVEREGDEEETVRWWERVMEGCFGKLDEEVRANVAARTVGSTALAAVVADDEVVVANCGDSRAVLCRGGIALPLSTDHKPDRQDELERIEAAGGRVINWNGFRVLGVLATSRSIGDQYLRPFVISKPEVTVTKRTDKDEFVILASDGLWDVLSNETACKVVRKCLEGKLRTRFSEESVVDQKNRATEAAAVLVDLAMARGSRDNISVIVVDLRKP